MSNIDLTKYTFCTLISIKKIFGLFNQDHFLIKLPVNLGNFKKIHLCNDIDVLIHDNSTYKIDAFLDIVKYDMNCKKYTLHIYNDKHINTNNVLISNSKIFNKKPIISNDYNLLLDIILELHNFLKKS